MTKIITRLHGQRIEAQNFTMLAHRLIAAQESPYIDWDADPYESSEDAHYSDMVDALGVRLSAQETEFATYSEGDWDSLIGGAF